MKESSSFPSSFWSGFEVVSYSSYLNSDFFFECTSMLDIKLQMKIFQCFVKRKNYLWVLIWLTHAYWYSYAALAYHAFIYLVICYTPTLFHTKMKFIHSKSVLIIFHKNLDICIIPHISIAYSYFPACFSSLL